MFSEKVNILIYEKFCSSFAAAVVTSIGNNTKPSGSMRQKHGEENRHTEK